MVHLEVITIFFTDLSEDIEEIRGGNDKRWDIRSNQVSISHYT